MKFANEFYKFVSDVKRKVLSLEDDDKTVSLDLLLDGESVIADETVVADGVASVIRTALKDLPPGRIVVKLRVDGALHRAFEHTAKADEEDDAEEGTVAVMGKPAATMAMGEVIAHLDKQGALNDQRYKHDLAIRDMRQEVDFAEMRVSQKNQEIKALKEKLKETTEDRDKYKVIVDTDQQMDRAVTFAKNIAPFGLLFVDDPKKEKALMMLAGIPTDGAPATTQAALPQPKNDQEKRALVVYEYLKDPDNAALEPDLYDIFSFLVSNPALIAANAASCRNPTQQQSPAHESPEIPQND